MFFTTHQQDIHTFTSHRYLQQGQSRTLSVLQQVPRSQTDGSETPNRAGSTTRYKPRV